MVPGLAFCKAFLFKLTWKIFQLNLNMQQTAAVSSTSENNH
jgi:hypothetical protein